MNVGQKVDRKALNGDASEDKAEEGLFGCYTTLINMSRKSKTMFNK